MPEFCRSEKKRRFSLRDAKRRVYRLPHGARLDRYLRHLKNQVFGLISYQDDTIRATVCKSMYPKIIRLSNIFKSLPSTVYLSPSRPPLRGEDIFVLYFIDKSQYYTFQNRATLSERCGCLDFRKQAYFIWKCAAFQ